MRRIAASVWCFCAALGISVVVAALLPTAAAAATTDKAPSTPALQSCAFPGLDTATSRLQQAVRFRTVSDPEVPQHAVDPAEFEGLDTWLRAEYAPLWRVLKLDTVNRFSYLITWPGSAPDLLPVLFVSHTDVVPVPPETLRVRACCPPACLPACLPVCLCAWTYTHTPCCAVPPER
jgi:hypothetical protein